MQSCLISRNCPLSFHFNRGTLCHITRLFIVILGAAGGGAVAAGLCQFYLPLWGAYVGIGVIAVSSVLFALSFVRLRFVPSTSQHIAIPKDNFVFTGERKEELIVKQRIEEDGKKPWKYKKIKKEEYDPKIHIIIEVPPHLILKLGCASIGDSISEDATSGTHFFELLKNEDYWETACLRIEVKYPSNGSWKKAYEETYGFLKHVAGPHATKPTTTTLAGKGYQHLTVGERYLAYTIDRPKKNDPDDRVIIIFDLLMEREVGRINLDKVQKLTIDDSREDGQILLFADYEDGSVIYNIKNLDEVRGLSFSLSPPTERLDDNSKIACYDKDRYVILSKRFGKLTIKDKENEETSFIPQTKEKDRCVTADLRGGVLVSGNNDGSISIFDMRLQVPNNPTTPLQFQNSPPQLVRLRGHRLVIAYQGGLYLLNYVPLKNRGK